MPVTIPGRIKCIIFTLLLLCTINVKSPVNALSHMDDGVSDPQYLFSRNLRVPFQHKGSMMTARGFGKRSFPDYSDDGWELSLLDRLLGQQHRQMQHVDEVDTKRSPHIMEIREPRLRFRLADDGNLRIGRGFGKRSLPLGDGQKEESFKDKTPWTSPSIREWNEAENILKAVLKQVQDAEKNQN